MIKLNLQMFAGEEGGAAAAPETAGAETAAAGSTESAVTAGQNLADGTQVQNAQVAAALERQMRRHPNLREVYRGQPQAGNPEPGAGQGQPAAAPSIEQRWEEMKKGEFAEMYGRDVQRAIQDRFKNQQGTEQQLKALEPMLKVLRDRAGVGSNEDLIKHVMDDDSLYEEAASDAGMTVTAYKAFKKMEAERDAQQQREAQFQRQQMITRHLQSLANQAEAMKANYPDFDLQKELQNPQFFRLTRPEVGVSVEDAFYAVHHKELAPRMMNYGMQRAKQQMGQTLQAQRQRPTEGAMRNQGQPAAEMKIDPSKMTRKERAEIKRRVHMGDRVSFD